MTTKPRLRAVPTAKAVPKLARRMDMCVAVITSAMVMRVAAIRTSRSPFARPDRLSSGWRIKVS